MRYNISAVQAMEILYGEKKGGVSDEAFKHFEEENGTSISQTIEEFSRDYAYAPVNRGRNLLYVIENIKLKEMVVTSPETEYYHIGVISMPNQHPVFIQKEDISLKDPYIHIIDPANPYVYSGSEEDFHNTNGTPDLTLLKVNIRRSDWRVSDFLKYCFCDNMSQNPSARLIREPEGIAAAIQVFDIELEKVFAENENKSEAEKFLTEGENKSEASDGKKTVPEQNLSAQESQNTDIVMHQYQYICYDEPSETFIIFLADENKQAKAVVLIPKGN